MFATLLLAALAVPPTGQYQEVVDRMGAEQEVPGVSAVITVGDQVLFAGASGVADIETQRPMTAATVVYAGSLSKVFTAVLALQLVEEGELSLDDTVKGIATQATGESVEITVAQLLTHASGLERERHRYHPKLAFRDKD